MLINTLSANINQYRTYPPINTRPGRRWHVAWILDLCRAVGDIAMFACVLVLSDRAYGSGLGEYPNRNNALLCILSDPCLTLINRM